MFLRRPKKRFEELGLQWHKSGYTYVSSEPQGYTITRGLQHWTLWHLNKDKKPRQELTWLTWGSAAHCMRVAEMHHILGEGKE